ncbi:hypothetical protein ADJ76_08785 [Schaalia meyeri]|uniref:DUF2510 domain-containing protein n=1 Tax=Schaalia meyeri TaxID=52773 RepID=A0AAP9Y652_9ACTO|nr:DUF2510 domain-containing protein [Schaalia meyeri]AKU65810.1 hypothetical protein ADJ76_08785 [Schaalia meyeri]QQC43457.1 DUF2510 domain-containing protein [Schaalia meyeri]SDR92665.1 Protein of unknown function [Schaalia meyeri]
MSNPVQGWYADPAGSTQLRWWDGTQWTDQYRAEETTPPGATPAAAAPVGATPTGAAPVRFVPIATVPHRRASTGQILFGVLASVMAVVFVVSSLVTTIMYAASVKDYSRAETELMQANRELQEAQEGAK